MARIMVNGKMFTRRTSRMPRHGGMRIKPKMRKTAGTKGNYRSSAWPKFTKVTGKKWPHMHTAGIPLDVFPITYC